MHEKGEEDMAFRCIMYGYGIYDDEYSRNSIDGK